MKKTFLILSILLMTSVLIGQTPDKSRKDFEIYKPTPGIFLHGSGALINFNDGDLVLTQSANILTLVGGNLDLGTNSLMMTGSIGATGARITKGWFTNLEITNLPTINGASLSALYTSGNISIGANSLLLTGSIAATGNRVTKGWFTDAEFTNSPTIGGTAISAIYVPYTGASTTLALGANSITMTGSIGATGARATKVWTAAIESTAAPTIGGISMAQVMTVSKTIGGVGVAACDFNFATATNQTPQPIDLGALVPANARILNVQTVTNNTFTGAITLAAITGTTTGANDLITTAAIYTAAAITATPNGGVFIAAPSATAVHVWLTATPGANWSLVTAGKVTVYITYIAY
jgi:hypothetical protein